VPLVADSALQNPAQLWVYNSGTSQWSRIHAAGAQNLSGEIGENAAYCGRPSIGQNPASGTFYCAWEEFDSLNFEPTTGRLRADIFVASSPDGATWGSPTRLTNADATSKRFPFLARNCSGDSLAIGFEQDSIAGFNSGGTGAISRNPICIWHGTVSGAVSESRPPSLPPRLSLTASLIRNVLNLQSSFCNLKSEIVLLDASGRRVMSLRPGPNDVSSLPGGAYFIRQQGLGIGSSGPVKTTKILKIN